MSIGISHKAVPKGSILDFIGGEAIEIIEIVFSMNLRKSLPSATLVRFGGERAGTLTSMSNIVFVHVQSKQGYRR